MKDKILELIEQSPNWVLIKDQDNIKMIQLQNGARKMNIYWGTMTVVYAGAHPLTVPDVSLGILKELLGIKRPWWKKILNFGVEKGWKI